MVSIVNLLRCRGMIGRGKYFAIGAILLIIKLAIDWSIARLIFGREWSPAEYLAPGISLALLFSEPEQRRFYLAMLLIALPFIYSGVSLTTMRLRSVGLSAGWSVLFFVPGINFALFALLLGLPEKPRVPLAALAIDDGAPQPAPHSGAAPALDYRNDAKGKSWLNVLLPANPAAAKAVAIFFPALVALVATFVSVEFFSDYGWGVFVAVPFAIGLISSVLFAARTPRGVRACIGVACLSLTVYGVAMLIFAFEGAVCLIMAAPLAYPVTIVGAVVGASLSATVIADARRVVGIMLLFLPLFMGAERIGRPPAPLFAVTSVVEIDAPPENVWANVIGFREIPPPSEWLFRTGIAYPIRAQISGHGSGAIRDCVFSTGAFVEPIQVWDEPRLLKFDVTSNPPPMKEMSLWKDIHPPHLKNFLVSEGGQFRLIELPGNRTRLEGTTWYRHHMWPASYWRLWSDFIIHRIHLRVLNHVKALSEAGN